MEVKLLTDIMVKCVLKLGSDENTNDKKGSIFLANTWCLALSSPSHY